MNRRYLNIGWAHLSLAAFALLASTVVSTAPGESPQAAPRAQVVSAAPTQAISNTDNTRKGV